jgi:hypothetical protein
MSPLPDGGDTARRPCLWTFGLLMLIGLAACGASDQPADTNHAAAPSSAGAPQQSSAAPKADAPTSTPAGQPLGPTTQMPTPALRPRSSAPPAPPAPPRPIRPTVAPPAPTTPAGAAGGWQSHQSASAGFSIAYPPDWTASEHVSEDGASITQFTPAGGGPGVNVVVQAGPPAVRQPETSSRICERVTAGRLFGTRCRDTGTGTIATTLVGTGRTFIIATTGKGVDEQLYQRFLDSFAPTR